MKYAKNSFSLSAAYFVYLLENSPANALFLAYLLTCPTKQLVCIFNSFCYAGAIRYGARPGAVPGWSSIQIWAKRGRVIPFIPPRSIRLRPASGRGDPILFIPKRANSRIFYICPSPTTDLPITAAGSLGVLPEEDIRTTLVFRMRKMVDRPLTPRQ